MTLTRPEVPDVALRVIADRKAVLDRLSAPELDRYRAWRQACRQFRESCNTERKEAAKSDDGLILSMWGEGEPVDEMASVLNIGWRSVYARLAKFGLKAQQGYAKRWRRLWIRPEYDRALHRLAHDFGKSIPETLEAIGEAVLGDDALIARRALHVTRKAGTL